MAVVFPNENAGACPVLLKEELNNDGCVVLKVVAPKAGAGVVPKLGANPVVPAGLAPNKLLPVLVAAGALNPKDGAVDAGMLNADLFWLKSPMLCC